MKAFFSVSCLVLTAAIYSALSWADDPPPVVYLSFDNDMNDAGPYQLKSEVHGDEVSRGPGIKGKALFVGGTEDWLDIIMDEAIFLEGGSSFEVWFRREDWTNPYAGGSGFQSLVSISGSLILDITAIACPVAPPWTLVATVSYPLSGVQGRDVIRAYTEPDVVAANRWIHGAVTYDQQEQSLTVYMNGEEVDRAYGVPAPSFRRRVIRVGTWFKANQAFRGYLDELKIYDYPLSPDAIRKSARANIK
jgi:hypothetical protein